MDEIAERHLRYAEQKANDTAYGRGGRGYRDQPGWDGLNSDEEFRVKGLLAKYRGLPAGEFGPAVIARAILEAGAHITGFVGILPHHLAEGRSDRLLEVLGKIERHLDTISKQSRDE